MTRNMAETTPHTARTTTPPVRHDLDVLLVPRPHRSATRPPVAHGWFRQWDDGTWSLTLPAPDGGWRHITGDRSTYTRAFAALLGDPMEDDEPGTPAARSPQRRASGLPAPVIRGRATMATGLLQRSLAFATHYATEAGLPEIAHRVQATLREVQAGADVRSVEAELIAAANDQPLGGDAAREEH